MVARAMKDSGKRKMILCWHPRAAPLSWPQYEINLKQATSDYVPYKLSLKSPTELTVPNCSLEINWYDHFEESTSTIHNEDCEVQDNTQWCLARKGDRRIPEASMSMDNIDPHIETVDTSLEMPTDETGNGISEVCFPRSKQQWWYGQGVETSGIGNLALFV